jgi:hypothetical protein
MKYFCLVLILLCGNLRLGFSQDIIWEGAVGDKNLYLLNPGSNLPFCIKEILINGKTFEFESESNAVEIPITEMGFKSQEIITLSFWLNDTSCQPVLINEDALLPIPEFEIPSLMFTKKSSAVSWKPQQLDTNASYVLQQYVFGKWKTIKELGKPEKMVNPEAYPTLCGGNNYFRFLKTTEDNIITASQKIKVRMPVKALFLESNKVKDWVEFPLVTHYEIIDSEGVLRKEGIGKSVSVADLPKGVYWVHFDMYQDRILKR